MEKTVLFEHSLKIILGPHNTEAKRVDKKMLHANVPCDQEKDRPQISRPSERNGLACPKTEEWLEHMIWDDMKEGLKINSRQMNDMKDEVKACNWEYIEEPLPWADWHWLNVIETERF